MAKIAFFSDDDAGEHCARLTCLGLAQLDGQTVLVLPGHVEGTGDAPPEGTAVADLAERANAFDVERALQPALRCGADVVAALPLARLGDEAVRLQFDAAIAVGRDHVPAARALRAARYVAVDPLGARDRGRDLVPAWFLAGADQPDLMTKARLSPVQGPPLPFATRSLPMALPRLSAAMLDDLRAWRTDDAVLGTGTLLAALALAVASDPTAPGIDAAGIAAMMAARELPAERRLAERLVGLAEVYGRLTDSDGRRTPERSAARSRERRRLARPTPATADAWEMRPARLCRLGRA